MSEQSWWQRALATINREYERRIRRASLVSEYGADHHGHAHGAEAGPDHAESDADAAVIMNVPKGTPVGRRIHSETSQGSEPPPT